jgi:asparagine synthase (glutamine-hydrolysing)
MDPELFLELQEALERAVENSCRGEKVGVLFSGGLDSTLIAFLAKRHAASVELFTAGTEDSNDLAWAVRIAKELALPLNMSVLSEDDVLDLYGEVALMVPGDLLKVELGVPLLACCREAKRREISTLLSGAGAEELFGGYQRHWEEFEKGNDVGAMLRKELEELPYGDVRRAEKVAFGERVRVLCPLLDDEFARLAMMVPVEEKFRKEEGRKGVLRGIARKMGVPEDACARPKQALQYGSGIHKVLMRKFGNSRRIL